MIGSYFQQGILSRTIDKGQLEIEVIDLKPFAENRYQKVDRKIYGRGRGMLFQAPVLKKAVDALHRPGAKVIVLCPAGTVLDNRMARRLAREEELILIAARYEGVDQRYIELSGAEEISIGDYVLTGGELPALVLTDAIARFLPDSVKAESADEESFENGLLENPHYTEPREWEGLSVPDVLFSGDHGKVDSYRYYTSLERTYRVRPEMLWDYRIPFRAGAAQDRLKQIRAKNEQRKRFLELIQKLAKEWKDGRRNGQKN